MYKLFKDKITNSEAIIRIEDGALIPKSEENTDYQAYLAWLTEGNVPESADE